MFKFLVFYLFVLSCSNWILKTRGSDDDDEPVVFTPHIWNGMNASMEKWPFMASFRVTDGQVHGCGAAILNDDTIITAAHCIGDGGANPKDRFMALGQAQLAPLDNSSVYQLSKYILHPQYNQKNVLNDIALVKLSQKIDFKKVKGQIGKICLPNPNTEPDGTKCVALGWGGTEPGKDTKGVLQQVDLPIISCKNGGRPSLLCAGYWDKPKGTCFGDSGGPLVCPPKDKPNTYLLYGVSSILFGECGKAPAGFTKVANYLDWIKQIAEA